MKNIKEFSVWDLIKILVALVLLVIILSRLKFDDLLSLFEKVPLLGLMSYFFVYFLMTMAKAFQYYVLIDRRIPYFRMLYIMVINITLSNFVATSAGITSYLTMLKLEDGIKMTRTATIFIITKITDILFIGLFLGVSSWMLWTNIVELRVVTIALVAGISLLIITFLATVLFRKSFVRIVESVLKAFHIENISMVQRGVGILWALAEQEQMVVLQTMFRAFYLSGLYFSLALVLSVMTYELFAVSIDIWSIFFVSCFLQLISLVPISVFGGLGVNEISLAYLYGFFGLSQNEIPVLVIGIRVLGYVMGVVNLWYLPVYMSYIRYKNRTV